jgi:hypothetical protein
VRAELWDLLRREPHEQARRLDDAEVIANDIAQYARSCTPPGLEAQQSLGSAGSFESRTATRWSARAGSTQSPPELPLRLDFRHPLNPRFMWRRRIVRRS